MGGNANTCTYYITEVQKISGHSAIDGCSAHSAIRLVAWGQYKFHPYAANLANTK